MIIELNIGLNVDQDCGINASQNTLEQRNARATAAFAYLRHHLTTAGSVLGARRELSASEDTLVMQLSISRKYEAALHGIIFQLAEQLQQDCIAIYNPEEAAGVLVGPNAVAWGDFNPMFFIRWEEPQAAAGHDREVRYTGHGANTGGLQGHSVGPDYPYMVIGVQDRLEAPTEWCVMDTRTSRMSARFPTQQRAIIEMASLRARNMMHS